MKVGNIFSSRYKYPCKLPALHIELHFSREEDFRDLHPTKATQELSLKIMCYSWIEFKHIKAINIEKPNQKLVYKIGMCRLT